MKKGLILLLLVSNFCISQNKERKLVWEENFNVKKLNETNWNFELGDGCPNLCGWGNNEKQIYTKTNHTFKKGKLILQAQKEGAIYTSTKITTKGKKEFQYGKIEVKAKLPTGNGLWPAFWMLGSSIQEEGWPKCGEIDILEYVGREPDIIFTTLHTQDSHGNSINTKKTKIENIEDGFHIYGIDWTAEKIEFFVDGNSVYTFNPKLKNKDTWPFDKKFYIILNLAIGGNFGGSVIDDSILPQKFIIDYIRVYQ